MTKPTRRGDKLYYQPGWSNTWFGERITNETSQSWLCGTTKINKKTLQENQGRYGNLQWFTTQGKSDYVWLHENRIHITAVVSVCRDVAMLKQIAALVGCKVK